MSLKFERAVNDLVKVLQETNKQTISGYDTQAKVLRVDGNIAWVQIPGAPNETPVQMTTTAKKGDVVQVRVAGGNAWTIGNITAPPTDDTKAIDARNKALEASRCATSAMDSAKIAKDAADQAISDASIAQTAAGEAQTSSQQAAEAAQQATTNADTAIAQAQSATESASAAGRSAALAQAAAEAAQGDIDEQENWFWHDSLGAHILGQTSGFRTDLASNGMDIVAIALQKIVAHFGADNVTLGSLNEAIRAVITNTRLAFRTDSGDIAYFGLNDEGIWQMHIATTFVDDMIRFGDYAWIKRDNGNMSIKWLGEVE